MSLRSTSVVLLVLLAGYLVAAKAQSGPCSCADKKDLLNRLNIIETAIMEYDAQIPGMIIRETADGKPLMWTEKLYNEVLQVRVNNAMQRIRDPLAQSGTAKTNGGDCSLEYVRAPGACLRETLTRHESVHQSSCRTHIKSLGLTETYQSRMRLVDFAKEEIAAYERERAFILQQLKALPAACQLHDWVGFVDYQQYSSTETIRAIPPRNTNYPLPSAGIVISYGGTANQTIKSGYFGTIYIEGGRAASAKAGATYVRNDSSLVTGRIFCDYTRSPNLAFSNNVSDVEDLSGEITGSASVRVNENPRTRSYAILISFFPVQLSGSRVFTESNPAPCIGQPKTYTTSLTTSNSASPYTITGSITDPDFFWGSNSDVPPPLQSSTKTATTTVTRSFTINTRWMLRRL